MTDMATTFGPELEESRETSPVTSVTSSTETQALITEQQVLFSTAAAVALPPAKTRRWGDAVHAVARRCARCWQLLKSRLRESITRSGMSGSRTR